MSLNTSNTPDGRGVLIYTGEIILLYTKRVVLSFDGHSEAAFKGKKEGALYLTSHRIIFVNEKVGQALQSFALPFFAIDEVKLEQPLMGSNYLKGRVQSLPGGNFMGDVKWKLSFPKGGCIDFGHALLQAHAMAQRQRPTNAPPEYNAPPPQSFYAAQAKQYTQEGPYYGFQAPTNVFPDRPRDGEVFMYDAPPPYPGIGPAPAYNTTQPVQPSAPSSSSAAAYPMGQAPPYPSGPAPAYPSPPAPSYPGYAEAPPLPQKN